MDLPRAQMLGGKTRENGTLSAGMTAWRIAYAGGIIPTKIALILARFQL